MLAHFLAALALFGSALLLLIGLGVSVYGLARGDRRLARRALVATAGLAGLYLLGVVLSPLLAPRRVLPRGEEIAFCGFDCHLHVSVVSSEIEGDGIGVGIRVRSDARQEPEYPRYLQFRLVGTDRQPLPPVNGTGHFARVLQAGESYVDSLYFTAPPGGAPYTLRVIYPDLLDALLLGPANSAAVGKTTLSLGE